MYIYIYTYIYIYVYELTLRNRSICYSNGIHELTLRFHVLKATCSRFLRECVRAEVFMLYVRVDMVWLCVCACGYVCVCIWVGSMCVCVCAEVVCVVCVCVHLVWLCVDGMWLYARKRQRTPEHARASDSNGTSLVVCAYHSFCVRVSV